MEDRTQARAPRPGLSTMGTRERPRPLAVPFGIPVPRERNPVSGFSGLEEPFRDDLVHGYSAAGDARTGGYRAARAPLNRPSFPCREHDKSDEAGIPENLHGVLLHVEENASKPTRRETHTPSFPNAAILLSRRKSPPGGLRSSPRHAAFSRPLFLTRSSLELLS
jgi:hypothetical protein